MTFSNACNACDCYILFLFFLVFSSICRKGQRQRKWEGKKVNEIKPDGKYIFSCSWEDIDKAIQKLHDLKEKYRDDEDSERKSRERAYRKDKVAEEKSPCDFYGAIATKA